MNTLTYFKIKKTSPIPPMAHIIRSIEFYTKEIAIDVDFRYEDF
jgi:hypothetical protein